MRFTDQINKINIFNSSFIFLLLISCLISVSCQSQEQTREQKLDSIVKKCQSLVDQNNLLEASNCFGQAVISNPDIGMDISKAGKISVFKECVSLKKDKDYQNAIICLEGYTELDSENANTYYLLADSYYQFFKQDASNNGQRDLELLDKSEESVQKGLEINSNDASAHGLYGEILENKGEFNKSLIEYQKATEIKPDVAVFWTGSALVQEKLIKNEDALLSYEKALKINPCDTTTLYFQGLLFWKMGKLDNALKNYEKILNIEPNDEEIL